MAEVVGGPIDLNVCENCPRRDRGQDLSARAGQADVVVSEKGVRGAYVTSGSRSAGNFEEHSTAIYMSNQDGYDAFERCAKPIKDGFLQRIGLAEVSCPALKELVGGEPSDGDIVADYIERLQPVSK